MRSTSSAEPAPASVPAGTAKSTSVTPAGNAGTRLALLLGAFGGPLFLVLVAIQMAIVPWFDITRFPLSVLSVGETAWVQKSAFLLGGLLILIGSIGLRRALRGGPGGSFGPVLIGVFGTGLVGSGIFDVDPGDGAPPGSAALAKADYSWHMYAHNLSSMLAFVCLAIACFVFIRRFVLLRKTGWTIASAFVGASTFILFLLPVGGPSLRLAIATVFMFAWTTTLFLSTRAAAQTDL